MPCMLRSAAIPTVAYAAQADTTIQLTTARQRHEPPFAFVLQTVADLGTISAVNIQGAGSNTWTAMANTFGAAWEVSNQPAYPISLEVTSGSQTVSAFPYSLLLLCLLICLLYMDLSLVRIAVILHRHPVICLPF